VTDEVPRPAFTVGAKSSTTNGYRASDYNGTLAEFMDSGERAALVDCEAISQHAVYIGLSRLVETRRLPVEVSKRVDGVHLTRTESVLDAPLPKEVAIDGTSEKPEEVPRAKKPSLISRLTSRLSKS
jgi:hypothetical protein